MQSHADRCFSIVPDVAVEGVVNKKAQLSLHTGDGSQPIPSTSSAIEIAETTDQPAD